MTAVEEVEMYTLTPPVAVAGRDMRSFALQLPERRAARLRGRKKKKKRRRRRRKKRKKRRRRADTEELHACEVQPRGGL